MEQRSNIVFVHVDQLKHSAIEYYGCNNVKTPHINGILDKSVHFSRSYTAVSQCVPARTTWFTGLNPEQSGIIENGMFLKDASIPELGGWLSKKGGYDSYYMGKWHVAMKPPQSGFTFLQNGNPIGEYGDTAVSQAASNFLLNHRGEKPFFLSVGLLNPHDICYWDFQYTPGKFSMAKELKHLLPDFPKNYIPENDKQGWSKEEWQFYIYTYFRFVEMVDAEVGRIFRAYLRSPNANNTIFIFSSDHGQGNAEHGWATKNSPYEHSMKVPLAIVDPQGHNRNDVHHLVGGLDMAPTICDYAQVERMPNNKGMSLKPLIRNDDHPWRDWLAVSTPRLKHKIVYKEDLKFIHESQNGRNQLFDLFRDPEERFNLAENREYHQIADELLKLCQVDE